MNGATAPDPDLLASFRAVALAEGLDPDNCWVGGYVDYEWAHLRRVIEAYGIELDGQRAFELGCNIGASSVVMARLGAQVEAIDVNPRYVRVAEANIALHGVRATAHARHVVDSRSLPFSDASFDFALANSVLEYVPPAVFGGVVAELARVLRPGGLLLICGTSNRLSPREVHSGKWLVNYLPRGWLEDGHDEPERGLSPFVLARSLKGSFEVVKPQRWLAARTAVHGKAGPGTQIVDRAARTIGLAPGWLAPNIELLLRRL